MTKFQKIQKISSIIPFWSTFFVAVVTIYELKCRKAPVKIWLYFIITFFLSGFAVYVLNAVIMTGQHLYLNVIASGLILAVANILFVDFQIMSTQKQQSRGHITPKMRIVLYSVAAAAGITGIVALATLLFWPSVDIADTNGSENINLAVIKEEEIFSTYEHYSALGSRTFQKGVKSQVSGKLKRHDFDEIGFSCQKISGIKVLQATQTMCDQLAFEIDAQLESGNLEIIIMLDGQYYDHVAVNQTSSVALNDIAGKTIVIKMAAESAKLNVSVKRIVGDNSTGD